MTTTNQGDQEIFPDYRMDAESKKLERFFSDLLPNGIYRGFDAVEEQGSVVLDPGVMFIRDGNGRNVRIETNSAVVVEPSSEDDFVFASWTYEENENWFAKFATGDDVLGRHVRFASLSYDGNGDLDAVDPSDRDEPTWAMKDDTGPLASYEEVILTPARNV